MKVGDKVKCVDVSGTRLSEHLVYTIKSVNTDGDVVLESCGRWPWNASRFELVPEPKFKVGDYVCAADETHGRIHAIGEGRARIGPTATSRAYKLEELTLVCEPSAKFKVGDRVRDLSNDEVLTVARVYADGSITGTHLDGDRTAYGSNELEHFYGGPLDIRVGREYVVVPSATDAAFGACPESEDAPETISQERFEQLRDAAERDARNARNLFYGKELHAAALRYNEGKGEHDYLLTYPGGVDAAFSQAFDYYNTLSALADWYRGEEDYHGEAARIRWVVEVLKEDANQAGHDLASALAETNARGAAKYPKGNYLKGANYRQYCQSFIRHCLDLAKGLLYDAEGNNTVGAIAFNILALDMCVTQGIGTDDRIRKS